ncbi:MAG: aminotransferase class III-fold pyridoxal phosphate-dependent enzyme [Acidimicrobiia bacterium]|nr:aminotransferase class III-fold pyridoxal phosphate-dependent enzyme [Acidimicrobiia bacterium]MDH3463266.1 aminotransferase class III-fold pyridoxal phosphate-dependent enzyme [Acidimicrobiia bacterium]
MTDLIARHEDVIAPVIAFDTDIHAESAEGIWITDVDGKRWADFACGTAVTNLGHNHPAVVAAAHAQIDKLIHSGCIVRYDPLVTAAEKLRTITPPTIEKFAFANSGAEAVEASVKLAKYSTGRQGVIAFRGAFHGRTMGSVAYTTSNAKYRDGYHPVLGSVFIAPFPHPYRWGMTEDAAVEHALNELRLMLKHIVSPKNIAAFLVEPVQGEGGYYPAPPAFLSALREIAHEHGILLIYDEVQTGFGRTAEWFASDHFEAKPDILAMGKGIANGLPLSAYGASRNLIDNWPVGSHGTTFGGNPVAVAAAIAVMDTMEGLLPHARDLSKHAFERYDELTKRHPTIGDVRGLGLMIGVEFVEDRESRTPDATAFQHVQRHALDNNLIIIECGPDGNVLRFIPALVTTREELDWAIDIVDEGLSSWESRG